MKASQRKYKRNHEEKKKKKRPQNCNFKEASLFTAHNSIKNQWTVMKLERDL